MKNIVLIGNASHDTSIRVIAEGLSRKRGVRTVLFNGEELGQQLNASFSMEGRAAKPSMSWKNFRLGLDSVHGVWNRRAHEPVLVKQRMKGKYKDFALENWRVFSEGLWLTSPVARWVNEPVAHVRAANKLLQLQVAGELGLTVPRTLVTSEPAAARAFVQSCPDGAICKTLGSLFSVGTKTIELKGRHLAKLDTLPLCPAIFQEKVPVVKDLRVVVIGDDTFVGSVDTPKAEDKVDWRADPDNPWKRFRLPADVLDRCVRLTRRLGLAYGALDLRLTPSGEYVFFEINPGGQFLFLEVWTGMRISQKLVSYLVA